MSKRTSAVVVDSPIGRLHLAANGDGLTHLLFAASSASHAAGDGTAAAARILTETRRQLTAYFTGRRRTFELPLAPEGTEFQLAVWRGLRDIPYGETLSYGELARRIGRPAAVRAVGAANGANPISIIVPCHRVIGQNRRLTGYGGGLPAKKKLLEIEGVAMNGDRCA